MSGLTCHHGTLRRQCETCDLREDYNALLAAIVEWRAADLADGGMDTERFLAAESVLCRVADVELARK